MTRAVVKTGNGRPIEVELSSGHRFTFYADPEEGQDDRGPSSTEGVSAALASCTVATMGIYADRKGWDLEGVAVEVETTKDGPNPTLFEVSISFPDHLEDDQVSRLLVIAGKCPVHRVIAEATEVQVKEA